MIILCEEGFLAYVGMCAVIDGRIRSIPIWMCIADTIASIIYAFIMWQDEYVSCVSALVPGLFILFIAFISKENIGIGDGWLICNLGIRVGLIRLMQVLSVSFIFCGVTALILLCVKRKRRGDTIAFLPFLFVGNFLEFCMHVNC